MRDPDRIGIPPPGPGIRRFLRRPAHNDPIVSPGGGPLDGRLRGWWVLMAVCRQEGTRSNLSTGMKERLDSSESQSLFRKSDRGTRADLLSVCVCV